jgi:hypothetical protein
LKFTREHPDAIQSKNGDFSLHRNSGLKSAIREFQAL